MSILLVFMTIFVVCDLARGDPSHHHEHSAPQPYKFGYEVKDHEGSQHRHETGDGHGNVQGSYGYTDAKGLHRQVHYVADHNGFRAKVITNEPGTANQDPANVKVVASPTHHHVPEVHHHQPMQPYHPPVHHHHHVPHHHHDHQQRHHMPLSQYGDHHHHHMQHAMPLVQNMGHLGGGHDGLWF